MRVFILLIKINGLEKKSLACMYSLSWGSVFFYSLERVVDCLFIDAVWWS